MVQAVRAMASNATLNLTDMLSQSQPAFLHVYPNVLPILPQHIDRYRNAPLALFPPPPPPLPPFYFWALEIKTGSYIRMTWCMSGVTYPLPLQWGSWDVNQEAKVLLQITRGQLCLLLHLFDSRVSHLQGGPVIPQLFHPGPSAVYVLKGRWSRTKLWRTDTSSWGKLYALQRFRIKAVIDRAGVDFRVRHS